jgi:peptidoglycan hydrolase-like protein with peptidoglycan-binding domain
MTHYVGESGPEVVILAKGGVVRGPVFVPQSGCVIERAFTEELHTRGTGALGGQFVAAGAAKKTAPAKKGGGTLGFDGKRGAGYGVKGGDKRVHALQAALNKLGFTDGSGKSLVKDGKLGPRTTAAIKKAQRQLGLKPDGKVTPALLAQLVKAKSAKDLKPAAKKAAPAKKVPAKKAAPAYVKKEKPKPRATVHRGS